MTPSDWAWAGDREAVELSDAFTSVGVGLSIVHAVRYAQGARTEDVEGAMYAAMVGAAVAFVLMLLLQTYYRLAKGADGASGRPWGAAAGAGDD